VHVSVNDKGYEIDRIIDGETVAEVLEYVQYNAKKLVRTVETWVTSAVKQVQSQLRREGVPVQLQSGLYGYTYLE